MNWKQPKSRRLTVKSHRPSLRFDPRAWAKLVYFRDRGDTEIGGFGLTAVDDPLLVVDFLTVKQRTTSITVAFDDGAVADLFDEMVDLGIPPDRFSRIWLHSHPANCPLPSGTDEATFHRVFGRTDWSVMAILARGGASYARLSFHVGPGGSLRIPVRVDYGQPFDGADWAAWQAEFDRHVVPELPALPNLPPGDIAPDAYLTDELWDWEAFDGGTEGARSI